MSDCGCDDRNCVHHTMQDAQPSPIKELLDTHFLRPTERWRPPSAEELKNWITITIRFGEPLEEGEDDDESNGSTETFRFRTKEEADAFMTGVEASNGWMDYTTIEDGRYPEANEPGSKPLESSFGPGVRFPGKK